MNSSFFGVAPSPAPLLLLLFLYSHNNWNESTQHVCNRINIIVFRVPELWNNAMPNHFELFHVYIMHKMSLFVDQFLCCMRPKCKINLFLNLPSDNNGLKLLKVIRYYKYDRIEKYFNTPINRISTRVTHKDIKLWKCEQNKAKHISQKWRTISTEL